MQDTMAMNRLLLVEDDPELRERMKWALGEHFQVVEADSMESALARLEPGGSPVVCLDLGLDGRPEKGLDIIDAVLASDRGAKIVAITSDTDPATAKEAIRRGAFDLLTKPLDLDMLRNALERAKRIHDLEVSGEEAPSWVAADPDWPLIGESEAMRNVFSVMRRLAETDFGILISGESGTGKELCARAIHARSRRRGHPFVSVNSSAIPANALEAELFGEAKGQGSDIEKPGLLESAQGGTLFLDEIGDLTPALQSRLLRFLQEKRAPRVGEIRPRGLDVRLIAATAKPGLSGNGPGALRNDLFYRLSEFEVRLPPLRERGRDVLLLAAAIIERNRRSFGLPRLRMSSRAEKALLAYGWPGNVRELENRLNRAVMACKGQVIEEGDLQLGDAVGGSLSYREARKAFERNLLLNALERSNGNVSLAARTVGVTRPTFYDMMRKTGIPIRTEGKGVHE